MNSNQEKVRPGAMVLDLLGDLSRAGRREMRLKALVALGEDLGVPEPTMRVTLARLREAGWFDVRREGRESVYTLSPTGVIAIHEGGRRLHQSAPEHWGGDWSMVIYTFPESDRQTRDELRKQLIWLGFAPLAPATWIRPQPQLDDVSVVTDTLPAARFTLLTTRTSGLAADRALAARCWDLESLGQDYTGYVTELRARMPEIRQAAMDGRESLRARIPLVNMYRGFARRDPQFPVELQPVGWKGDEARLLFQQAHALLSTNSVEYYRQVLDEA